ncbi:isopentenyl-diphosphate delta-isomerase [Thiosulfativibrio zosterae]|uniref:Isopentenyl-diphosphate delta-isomerase n=2 Tax=Thiosulfativibrio zosterae TaxID=2675053 RepID=A0A6F8PLB8_9GAMM|nr:isopentenyl-diphosphate delta-isomerase [Thiosulfativibrio zosterae]
MTDQSITQRKQDHILALQTDEQIERQQSGFDTIQLSHRGLPELDFAEVSTQTSFLNTLLNCPLLISSMTGGAADNLVKMNIHLAEAAESAKVALAVGSQRAMILDAKAQKSFQLRDYAPNIPLIANIGAVQLNYGFGIDEARKAVDILQANALYLHLNPLQEVIQPEGDTNFAKLADKIEALAKQLEVPIILKEVGCGLSSKDIILGINAGIRWFDLAGRGGTSWSRIEAHRAQNDQQKQLGIRFQDWGLTTPQALQMAQPFQNQANFIASGGIRNGIDMVKSVIMGGQICGIAAPFLEAALDSSEAVVETIARYQHEFKVAQFLLGAPTVKDLFLNDTLLLKS